jgi:8-oxo-dGTP pyrophosphatase MutT (NUDIX family)
MSTELSAAKLMMSVLENYRPADNVEGQHIKRTLDWLATAGDPLNRAIYDPGHAVGSALLVTPDRRHVMLVLHGKLNRWLQAGGHAEPGEIDPLSVACREAWEEVGCKLAADKGRFIDLDIHTVPSRKTEPRHLHFDFRYLFELPKSATRPASDVLEARWFEVEEALALDLDEGLRRMIEKVKTTVRI